MATSGQSESDSSSDDERPMTAEHIKNIQSCRSELVNKMEPYAVLNYMLEKNALSQFDVDIIKAKGPPDSKVNEGLAEVVVKRSEKVYRVFMEALRETLQKPLANSVERTKGKRPGKKRNRKRTSGFPDDSVSMLEGQSTAGMKRKTDDISEPGECSPSYSKVMEDPDWYDMTDGATVADGATDRPTYATARLRSRDAGEADLVHNDRDFTADDYEELLQLGETIGDVVNKGMREEELHRLPTSVIRDRDITQQQHQENTQCKICLCDFEVDDVVRTLPCFHWFHEECGDKWLKEQAVCPICRFRITKKNLG